MIRAKHHTLNIAQVHQSQKWSTMFVTIVIRNSFHEAQKFFIFYFSTWWR